MAPRKKHPFNPVAPIYGKIPDLEIPADYFGADQSGIGFDSKCLNIQVNVTHAKAVFKKVRKNVMMEIILMGMAVMNSVR